MVSDNEVFVSTSPSRPTLLRLVLLSGAETVRFNGSLQMASI